LCNGKVIVVRNVTEVNVVSNIIYGSAGPYKSFGEWHNGGWFVIDASKPSSAAIVDERAFRDTLSAVGVTNLTLRPVAPLVKQFMFEGTLPFGR